MSRELKIARWVYALPSGCVLLLIALLLPMVPSRYYVQKAQTELWRGDLVRAGEFLQSAGELMPAWAMAGDMKRYQLASGELHIRRAESSQTLKGLVGEMKEAEKLFQQVVDNNPLDLDGYTGLARSTAALERIYPFVYKENYPVSALPYFQQLLKMMPVNLYTHELFTRYYLSRKMTAELHGLVTQTIGIYPPIYYQLIRQQFYSLAMNEMLKKALLEAIDSGIYVEEAYAVLADIASKEGDYSGAIDYFIKSKKIKPYKDNSAFDLQLGRLYLQAGRFAEASESFLLALQTPERESRFDTIWSSYRKDKLFNEFLALCEGIEDNRLAEQREILIASCLMELGRYELALSHLIRLNSKKYAAESLYLQARIAEYQKDWDTMELKSQRATVLAPQNSDYHLLFSKALNSQKKWPQAEKAASEAIHAASRPNPWLYNHRAWIRWSKKDYHGAQNDWEHAIAISPRTPHFYYSMALVYEQAGNIEGAGRQLAKALALKPDDPAYLKKHDQLQQKLQH